VFFKAFCGLIRRALAPPDLVAAAVFPGAGLEAALADVDVATGTDWRAAPALLPAVADDAALVAGDFGDFTVAGLFAGANGRAAVLVDAGFADVFFAAVVFADVVFFAAAFLVTAVRAGVFAAPAFGAVLAAVAGPRDALLAAGFAGAVAADRRAAALLPVADLPFPDLLAALLAAGLRMVAIPVFHRDAAEVAADPR
jgi:hypothetical protein